MKEKEFNNQIIGLESFIIDTTARYRQYHNIEDFYIYFQRYYFFVMAHSHELTPLQRKNFDNKHIAGLIIMINEFIERYGVKEK